MKGTELVVQMEAGGEKEMAQQQRAVTFPNRSTCWVLFSYRLCVWVRVYKHVCLCVCVWGGRQQACRAIEGIEKNKSLMV